MKKLFIALIALISFGQAFAQTGNDSSKYVWYKFTYGNRLSRYRADTVMMIPRDTIWSKDGLAMKNGVLYSGNGIKWAKYSRTPPPDVSEGGVLNGSQGIRDTVLTFVPCGAQHVWYRHYSLPQFIGFGVKVYTSMSTAYDDSSVYCLFEGEFINWNASTGDLYLFGIDNHTGDGYFYRIQGY